MAIKTTEEIRTILQAHRAELAQRYGVQKIALFGSYARGEQTPQSDLDLLVHLEKPIGFGFFELWDYLESILGIKVDLLTPGAFRHKPRLWEQIQEDLIYV
jgi:predicted nucleotidyltransferase